MEKPTPVSNQSYLNEVLDLAFHTISGAVASGLGAKFNLIHPPLVKEAAFLGAALNTMTGGVQKLMHAVIDLEESFASKTLISAATLGAAFFAMTQPSAASLLGRVGLDFAKDAIMKLCVASFVAEVVLGAVKGYITSAPSYQGEVDALSAEEIKEAFDKWTEKTAEKDGKDSEIPTAYQDAYKARFAKDGLYTAVIKDMKSSKDVVDARPDVIVFIFNTAPKEITLNEAIQKALDKRIDELKLAEKPADEDAVKGLNDAQVRHAFTHYTVFTDGMDAKTKAALDTKILEAHAKKPEDKEAASKMTAQQLTFIYANFASYTKEMDAEIVTALEDAIVAKGLVTVTKPTDVYPAAKGITKAQAVSQYTKGLTRMEVLAHHAAHDKTFGDPAKFADALLIAGMNLAYKKHNLAEKTVPTPIDPPTPQGTVEKLVGLWRAHAPKIVQDHERKIVTVATLATAEGLSVGFEALTGINVPYNGF